MNVFVFCEFSDTVSAAFRDRGHSVLSCDLLPSENPEAGHYQGDGRWLLREPWDLVIAHPPCTYLTVARGKPSDDEDSILEAIEFFIDCQNANAPRVAVENPLAYRFVRKVVGEHSQTLHPWHFGDYWQKRTCLWLRGLPPLMAEFSGVEIVPPSVVPSSSTSHRGFARGTAWGSGNPARSSFHPGMARAMAQQWGGQ